MNWIQNRFVIGLCLVLFVAGSTIAADRAAVLTTVMKGHTGKITCVAIAPDGTIASGSDDKTVRIWDRNTGKARLTLEQDALIYGLTFSADSKLLATGDGNKQVVVWDAATGADLKTLAGAGGAVTRVALSADGTLVAGFGGAAGKVWDLKTGQEKLTFDGRFAFSSDGKTLAYETADGQIHLMDVPTGKERLTLPGHHGRVGCLTFSPDGKTLASGGADRRGMRATGNEPGQDNLINLWDAGTGKLLASLSGHRKGIYSLTFSADSSRLIATDFTGDMKLWDVAASHLVADLAGVQADGKLRGTPIGHWAISPDFKTWVAGTETEVQVLDLTNFTQP